MSQTGNTDTYSSFVRLMIKASCKGCESERVLSAIE